MPRLVETSGEEDVKSLHDSRRTAEQAEGHIGTSKHVVINQQKLWEKYFNVLAMLAPKLSNHKVHKVGLVG